MGTESRDDAAVYDIGNGQGIISTTDFFMPVVDDAQDFGRVAVTNALSDVYAMGGRPIMAIAILGWPVGDVDLEIANQVVEGGRIACTQAGIQLAGGHSIDAPEPIFGAAVTGTIPVSQIKRNNGAQAGDRLYLTKPLGIGVLTTAEKKSKLRAEHKGLAVQWMTRLNDLGIWLGEQPSVHAMTDVTGFGLAGHLWEMCDGADLAASIELEALPLLDGVQDYIARSCVPGGTLRNFESYGSHLDGLTNEWRAIVCDPQTSGGLLFAVAGEQADRVENEIRRQGHTVHCIGEMVGAAPHVHFR